MTWSITSQEAVALRTVGFDDDVIFAATVFIALRLAFSTVNNAHGAQPDRELGEMSPGPLLEAITFG